MFNLWKYIIRLEASQICEAFDAIYLIFCHYDRSLDDQDLHLCVDSTHRIFRYEIRKEIIGG